jgi:ligand-binding SRPBCC domain-containing protein
MPRKTPASWWLRLLTTGDRPAGGIKTLRFETVVPVGIDEAFAFFSNAANLERLTPPWVNFRIRTAMPIEMREGALIDYHIAIYGMPLPWRTRIDVWEPGIRFVDRQVAGPYRWWRHEHRFEPVDEGTRVIDEVEFVPRAAWLSAWLVRRDVGRIFEFRQHQLARLLAADSANPAKLSA